MSEIDKSKELMTSVVLVNSKLNFKGYVDESQSVSIDYTPPLGDNLGFTSLELFLMSLSSCAGSAILTLLRRMNKNISMFEIQSKGTRKQQHPTGFSSVLMMINLSSPDITMEDIDKAIELSEGICPVWSMLKGNVEIDFDCQISE